MTVENFTQARRIAKNAYSNEMRDHDITPSHTDGFTDGFYASRDWCWEVMKRFIPADLHLEAAKILGVRPFDSKP